MIGPSNPFSLSASDGHYFLDLTGDKDGNAAFGGVEQSIATVVGANYVLSFDLGSDKNYNASTGGIAGITATAGSTTQNFTFQATGSNQWQTETLRFTATASSTEITLTGSEGNHYIGLDNVSVDAVPEPASLLVWSLLAGGSAGLVAARKRRGNVSGTRWSNETRDAILTAIEGRVHY